MLTRVFAIVGILFALFGVMVALGMLTSSYRRRIKPLHRLHPDEGDVPWDLTDWIPVGFVEGKEWNWMPKFRIVE